MHDEETNFGAFRSSLLLRLADSDKSTITDRLFERTRRASIANTGSPADDLVSRIRDEIATIDERVHTTWKNRVNGVRGRAPRTSLIVGDMSLGASIRLPHRRQRAEVDFALGAALAIDDLVLFAATVPVFLLPGFAALEIGDPSTPFEFPEPLPIVGSRLVRDDRFAHYGSALVRGSIVHEQLTHTMPAHAWRLLQASLLSELTIAWVLFHERAHWTMGHLDFIGAPPGRGLGLAEGVIARVAPTAPAADPRFSTSRRGAERRLKSEIHRVLELHADEQAHLLLYDYAVRPGGAKDRFNEAVGQFDFPDDPRVLRQLSNADCLRLSLTAASIACLAFDVSSADPPKREDRTHPSAGARLMSMMISAPLVSSLVQRNDNGDWILMAEHRENANGDESPEFQALARAALPLALADAWIISQSIGASFSPLSMEAGDTGKASPTRWLEDLTRFWVPDDEELPSESSLMTESGIELANLHQFEPDVLSRLEPLQVARFGQPVRLDLGGIQLTN